MIEPLEDRRLLAVDFGDAPDVLPGTDSGDYNTLSADEGPSHVIAPGLFMGGNIDAEPDAIPDSQAHGDDIDGALPDDEDGVACPAVDLVLTEGAAPTVNVTVTNTTGLPATLYGWIDYNRDGVFDNASERADVPVSNGTSHEAVALVFPTVPIRTAGSTYARFRLGLTSDAASADPIGPAGDGEVEDYPVSITAIGAGTVQGQQKISYSEGHFGRTLDDESLFGSSLSTLGDLDGDGVTDVAVGVADDDGGRRRGAVWVLFLNADGSVKDHQKISDTEGNFTGTLDDADYFGSSVTSLGDLDGDGVTDMAVGAPHDDDGGDGRGAIWVLFLNEDGTVKGHQKISSIEGNFGGSLDDDEGSFGKSVAALGDLDGDGVTDLAVGVSDDDGGSRRGAVWVLFLNADGSVKDHQKISDTEGNFTGTLDDNDNFGKSVAALGDLDGDGVTDLAVGAFHDDDGGDYRGAVWILFLNEDGTVKGHQKISSIEGNFGGTLDNTDGFGVSLSTLGDLDGDGVTDLAVGAEDDDDGGFNRGAVWVLFLNIDGTVKGHQKISDTGVNFTGTLADRDSFGSSVASLGDLDGDGVTDLAVGANRDSDGGHERGAVWVLNLAGNRSPLARSDSYTTDENTPLTVGVTQGLLANDRDFENDPLTVAAVVGPMNGQLDWNPDGSFTYMPNWGFSGADSFVYHLIDAKGGEDLAFATIIVNDVPGTPVLASIHGIKFEDVDGNGLYLPAIDRPLAGVEFTLTGTDGLGNIISQATTTGANGEFAFTGLLPSVAGVATGTGYTVTEQVPAGHEATTATVFSTDLYSGQHLVAFDGQADPLGDDQTQVIVGVPLMFGNRLPLTTLTVDTFNATPWGFEVEFSRAVNPDVLNLYDVESGILGPADVTVVGYRAGSIAGSLVVDAGQLAFIVTGGVLPPDDYTVTLRSADDAFQDSTGELLDGNSDGMAGGDYVTVFTVDRNDTERWLTLPDFCRGPGQDVAVPTTASGIPLTLSDGDGVINVDFKLRYDPAMLKVTGVTSLPADWSQVVNLNAPGLALVSLWSSQPLAAGEVVVCEILAHVPDDAPYTASAVLTLEDYELNEAGIAVQADSAVQSVAHFGDVTGNRGYSGMDAALIARNAIGLDRGFTEFPMTDPLLLGDVTGNGRLSGLDAAFVARKGVGLPVDGITDLPSGPQRLSEAGPVQAPARAATFSDHEQLQVSGEVIARVESSQSPVLLPVLQNLVPEIVDLTSQPRWVAERPFSRIDSDAIRYGRLVHTTPARNGEFGPNTASVLNFPEESPPSGHMELLKIVLHEFGHALEWEDFDPLVPPTLAAGVRPLSFTTAVDAAIAHVL